MKTALPEVIRIMSKAHGWDISCHEESFVLTLLKQRITAVDAKCAAEYCARLSQDGAEARELYGALNISYSEFFRNPLTFALLEQLILPTLAAQKENSPRSEIRIWSAGCAAGQEAYSLAILLDEFSSVRSESLPYRIFATDVSESALETAREGIYDAASLQNVRLKHLRKYFVGEGTSYRIDPRLRDRIEFSTHNLLDEHSTSPPTSIYGDFDLVFCGNLLFYYRQVARQFILSKVSHALSADGYMATGEVEREIVEKVGGFRAVAPPAAVFQKSVESMK